MNIERLPNESDDELILRICEMKDLIGTWDQIRDLLNNFLHKDWGESAYRKRYARYNNEEKQVHNSSFEYEDSDLVKIQKERVKLQTEKIEFNKNIRELARDEMLIDKIHDAIATLPKLDSPEYIEPKYDKRDYLLTITDAHFGIEYSIPDFYGEIINEYSPEIFQERMARLFSEVIKTIEKENIKELTIFELGDALHGIIRLNSQLMQLRYGVVESAILYAEYMAKWLDALSSYVRIKFSMVKDSNHNQLRICGAPKNAFPDENMSYVINAFLKERLKDNLNIKIFDNPTGMCHAQLATYIVVGVHGENKDMNKLINDISRAYQHPIDFLIAGHVHHSKSEEVGIDSEVLNVKSIIGVDPYGLSLQKTSNAGANLFIFEQGKGKVLEYTYKLN